jgi:hypothetical protein
MRTRSTPACQTSWTSISSACQRPFISTLHLNGHPHPLFALLFGAAPIACVPIPSPSASQPLTPPIQHFPHFTFLDCRFDRFTTSLHLRTVSGAMSNFFPVRHRGPPPLFQSPQAASNPPSSNPGRLPRPACVRPQFHRETRARLDSRFPLRMISRLILSGEARGAERRAN